MNVSEPLKDLISGGLAGSANVLCGNLIMSCGLVCVALDSPSAVMSILLYVFDRIPV